MKFHRVDVKVHGLYDVAVEAHRWAQENFGKSKGPEGKYRWNEMVWYRTTRSHYDHKINEWHVRFYFREPSHAAWFTLRWHESTV
jgi:hypothetical protein